MKIRATGFKDLCFQLSPFNLELRSNQSSHGWFLRFLLWSVIGWLFGWMKNWFVRCVTGWLLCSVLGGGLVG